MADILHRVGIRASPEKIFQALSEQEGLAGWWTGDVEASPHIGAVNHFRFGDRGFSNMKVVELVPGKRVKWMCLDGAKEWIGTELTYDLRAENGSTILLFSQHGWKEPVEFMHYCSTKWAVYLLSLKSLCETGQGAPYPRDVDID
ncbi:MAG TPA: SRPBCC domain-containing protein [Candidatus Sulfotelmatobacter sp.]|nr:SRPBCC domain-containing protein [Candidatus Sulfotelmatobacter sp.]